MCHWLPKLLVRIDRKELAGMTSAVRPGLSSVLDGHCPEADHASQGANVQVWWKAAGPLSGALMA